MFNRRRSHNVVYNKTTSQRFNELENLYSQEIEKHIKAVAGKDSKSNTFTVRFSFLSSECFDALQLTDILLYLIRNKLERKDNDFTKIFDEYFFSYDDDIKALGFEEIYKLDQKFNFYQE